MPAFRCRERVVFLKDFNKDAFGHNRGGFPVGPNSEPKWARKGDTGVVSSWSKGGWLKVRLDRHGAVVTVRAGPYISRPTPPPVTKQPLWGQEARDKANKAGAMLGDTLHEAMNSVFEHLEEAQEKDKPADVELIENARLELEAAARLLRGLSFSLPTQISPFPERVVKPKPKPECTSGYLQFGRSIRQVVKEELVQGASTRDVVTEITKRWKALNKEERTQWRYVANVMNAA